MNIERALSTPGWSSEEELTFLAGIAGRSRNMVEIGSWRGRSARAMADNTQGIIYCVDTWVDHAIGIRGWWSDTDYPLLTTRPDWLFHEFKHNLSEYIDKTVFPYRLESLKASRVLHDKEFDLIFIDAAHDYASVKNDILAWLPLLSEGGILCGHDYNSPLDPEVKIAVDELIPKCELVGTIWIAR